MSERRRWPRLRRLIALAGWLTSMFEEPKGRRRLSMTRCAVAAFTVVYCARLLFLRAALGWPDAWLAFAVLFALPIAKALDRAPAQSVVEAVTGMFGKPAGGGGYFASSSTFTAAAPGEILTRDQLQPPEGQGRPDGD